MKLISREEKAEMVQNAMEASKNGTILNLQDASYSAISLCVGDFREIGWAEKITTRRSMYWHWKGPTAAYIGAELVQPNKYSEEIDMDWS